MKKILKFLFVGCIVAMTSQGADAGSFKRGVSENQFQYKAQMEALAPGVSWYYNWGNTPSTYLANEESLEYIPMCWNGNYNANRIKEYCASHPEVKYLLGFNEPNFTAQANLTPQKAAELWPAVQNLAKECGLQLVAPALNYSPNPPYTDPMKWMDEFVAIVGLDAFDYMALHNYGGYEVMVDLCTRFHEKYGKPIWLTEFCYWPEEGNPNSTVSPQSQISVMVKSLRWLEQTDWIYRYAWFKAIGNSSSNKGPNYGLLKPGKGEDKRELSDQGYVYVYIGDFNPEVYHSVNEEVNASDFIDDQFCQLGKSGGEDKWPIEITGFTSGAWADYQFEIPKEDTYTITLNVSGYGEPDRFDPGLKISLLKDDKYELLASERNFSLPNAEDTYIDKNFTVKLPAGKQTIRIQDMNPYQPSGIRIRSIKVADASGVDIIMEDSGYDYGDEDVYSLQGIRIGKADRLELLPAGIYVVAGKKIVVSSKNK